MGYRTLQRECGRQQVHVGGVLRRPFDGHEAEVVVAMRRLGQAPGVDDVDLRGEGVAGPQPGGRRQGDEIVAVVLDEDLGLGDRQLLECVPHPVVVAGLGVVVARSLAAGPLFGDHRLERGRGGVDDGCIGEGSLEGDYARSVEEGVGEFGLHGESGFGVGDDRTEVIAVVDDRVVIDRRGVWVLAKHRRLLDDRGEVGQAAIGLVQPTSGDVGFHICHASKCRPVRIKRG